MAWWTAAASIIGSSKQADAKKKAIEAQKEDPWATDDNTTLYTGIAIGAVVLILGIFFAIRAFNK